MSPEPRRKRVHTSSSDVAAVQTTEVSSVTGDEEEEEEESIEGDDEGAVEGPVNSYAHEEEDESVVSDISDDTVRCINMFAECVAAQSRDDKATKCIKDVLDSNSIRHEAQLFDNGMNSILVTLAGTRSFFPGLDKMTYNHIFAAYRSLRTARERSKLVNEPEWEILRRTEGNLFAVEELPSGASGRGNGPAGARHGGSRRNFRVLLI